MRVVNRAAAREPRVRTTLTIRIPTMGSLRSRPRPHRTFLLFIPALLALAVAASDTETLLPLRSFSLQPPFIDEQLGNRWWDFGGSTIIEVNTFVRLTPDVTSKVAFDLAPAALLHLTRTG